MISVLQLDTQFPRVPGDVASEASYLCDLDIIRIPSATVGRIVSDRPERINIAPFESALQSASGNMIVTSCGFLSHWQQHLAALTEKPLISSALLAFEFLSKKYQPDEVLTVTFDYDSLTKKHFGDYSHYADQVIGLPHDMHLKRVIADDLKTLDNKRAEEELVTFVSSRVRPQHKHVLLECTNLPPYKRALQQKIKRPVTDILSCIERALPGTVDPDFIT